MIKKLFHRLMSLLGFRRKEMAVNHPYSSDKATWAASPATRLVDSYAMRRAKKKQVRTKKKQVRKDRKKNR